MVGAEMPEVETEYPRLSIFTSGTVDQSHFEADSTRRQNIRLEGIIPDFPMARKYSYFMLVFQPISVKSGKTKPGIFLARKENAVAG